ncbi:MAG: adenosylhomocysteinase, partial [Chloroflexota bacterium]
EVMKVSPEAVVAGLDQLVGYAAKVPIHSLGVFFIGVKLQPLFCTLFLLPGRSVFLLAEGRLLNHAAAEANPAAVMDMSFANQVLAIEHLLRHPELAPDVYAVPRDLDEEIARMKLDAMGMRIDAMTDEQRIYANSWKAGT